MRQALLFFILLFAQTSLWAVDASVTYATFFGDRSPYVEVYIHIVGETVTFAPIDTSMNQARVGVTILLKKDGEVVQFEKYELNSPLTKDPIHFIDLKRFSLPAGDYQLEVNIVDQNNPENEETYTSIINIDLDNKKLQQSDVMLLASFEASDAQNTFTRNGYYMEPLYFNFYNKKAKKLIFYNEVYNTEQLPEGEYLLRYVVEQLTAGGDSIKTVMMGNKKRPAKAIDPVLIQANIGQLESGNYQLRVQVRNRELKLLSERIVFFQRSNPYLDIKKIESSPLELSFVKDLDEEQLSYSLRALSMNVPAGDVELINIMLKDKQIEAQRRYLFNYWAKFNPNEPAEAYQKYMEVARAVDRTYNSGFRHGFESDRGWIFLKYGKPNDVITVEDEPSAPPYEIWAYDSIRRTNQRNVKFLFYNPSLATGKFQLLHSTVRGEIQNPNWEAELYKNAPQDSQNVGDGGFTIYRRAREYFNDF